MTEFNRGEESHATPAEEAALNDFNMHMEQVILADGSYPTAKDWGTLQELREGRLAHGGNIVMAEQFEATEVTDRPDPAEHKSD